MVTVTDDPSLPASVQKKYVLEGEKLVMAIHQHPVVVSEPVATALAILAAVVAVDVNVTGSASALVDILWWVWFAAVARAAVLVFDYRQQWIIATDKRIMRTHGFFVRKVAMMPLSKVTDMSYHRSIPGRILGWGTFVMESAGTQQALSTIPFVPNPDDNYRALCAQIFGVDDARVAVADPQGRQEWVDEDGDGVDDRQSAYLVEPGPMSGRFVSVPRRPRAPATGTTRPTCRSSTPWWRPATRRRGTCCPAGSGSPSGTTRCGPPRRLPGGAHRRAPGPRGASADPGRRAGPARPRHRYDDLSQRRRPAHLTRAPGTDSGSKPYGSSSRWAWSSSSSARTSRVGPSATIRPSSSSTERGHSCRA